MRRSRRARLELTPLLDVMFLVLVFFIYCIFDMAVHRGIKVDLPKGRGEIETGERIVVTILADDSMQLNGVAMEKSAIVEKTSMLYKAGVKLPVIVSADRAASIGAGIGLLSDLKDAGVEKASFQVEGGDAK